MSILQRYIASTILSSTLMVLLVLLGLYTFMDFITELDDLGRGQYQLKNIAQYILLSMPKRIYELLPIAALLGSVLGLGSLASQSELVAMRAAGISIQQINKSVMVVALCLMVLAVFIGEVVRPPAEQAAREIQSMAKTGTIGSRSEHGFWTRDGLHFNHIDQILPDGRFSGISIYEFDDEHHLRILTKAKEAIYKDKVWILSDVVQSTIDEKGVKVRTVNHAKWKSQLNPGMVNIVVVPPEFLPVWGLLEYINYLDDNFQAVEKYRMAFWMKIMMPLSSAVMVFLAVPFVFGPLRSSSIGGRIVMGSLVGIGFHLFNQSFQHIGLVFGVLPWLSAALPTVTFAILGWYLMKRLH
ncbi:MAG: LPS export ABC transporter permease LptG [Gammaproteobacteria bacterium]|nr:MAG: LPS export ABC transporter permease LptG [Gammaproteobacteria bacterium]